MTTETGGIVAPGHPLTEEATNWLLALIEREHKKVTRHLNWSISHAAIASREKATLQLAFMEKVCAWLRSEPMSTSGRSQT